jgi:hypothetical protein
LENSLNTSIITFEFISFRKGSKRHESESEKEEEDEINTQVDNLRN